VGTPAWLGRRQERFDCTAAALLDFEPDAANEEAGLVVWMNERHHYEIFVSRRGGQRCAVVRRRIGSLQAEVACAELPEGLLELEIAATPTTYAFSCGQPGGPRQLLASGEAKFLATEVASGFTGVYFALYASANGQASQNAASFDWFEIR
jgi:alpha-N-arabinofuranosidase